VFTGGLGADDVEHKEPLEALGGAQATQETDEAAPIERDGMRGNQDYDDHGTEAGTARYVAAETSPAKFYGKKTCQIRLFPLP
jgi:hypothetical protein